MLRVISEFRPRYVVAENVRGAVNLALDTVYSGLVGEGYKVYPYVIPASAVGAPHQRERLFVVGVREDVHRRYTEAMAHPGCELRQGGSECGEVEGKAREGATRDAQFSGGTLWPTPRAQEPGKTTEGYGRGLQELVEGKEQRKLWPTPVKEDYRRRGPNSQQQGLPEIVHKLWPTPSARDHKDSPNQKNIDNPRLNEGYILPVEVYRQERNLWPTPSTNEDACGTPNGKMQKMLGNNPEVRKTSGQLNPDWVGQLMGYPEGWTDLDVDEPREWQGWPALLGERLWGTHTSTGACRSNRFLENADRAMSPVEFVSKGEESSQYPYEFPRTTTGCKNRAKRLKALGNAVVPAQAYPFFKAIAEIEKIVKEDNK